MFHNYTITIYNIGYKYNIAIYLYSRYMCLIYDQCKHNALVHMESDQEYLDHTVQSKIAVVIIK